MRYNKLRLKLMVSVCIFVFLYNSTKGLSWEEKYFFQTDSIAIKKIKGRLTDIKIASQSGDIVIGSIEEDYKGYVYYFDAYGTLLWKFSSHRETDFDTIVDICLKISPDGETIIVEWWNHHEQCKMQVYKRNGEKTLEGNTKVGGNFFYLSPRGKYIYRGNKIWTANGTPVAFKIKGIKSGILLRSLRFISEKEVEVSLFLKTQKEMIKELKDKKKHPSLKTHQYIVSFPEGKIKKEILNGIPIAIGDYRLLNYRKNKVYFLTLYDSNWNIVWEKKGFVIGGHPIKNHVCLSNDKEKLIVILSKPFSGIGIIDCKTGEIIARKKMATSLYIPSGMFFFIDKNNIIIAGEYVYHYLPNGSFPTKRYYTYILEFDNEYNIIKDLFVEGLIIGSNESPNIGIYYSESEKRSKRALAFCKDFQIKFMKRR